jgi:hypothetical protein
MKRPKPEARPNPVRDLGAARQIVQRYSFNPPATNWSDGGSNVELAWQF